jgi:hypothetical protein
MDCELGWGYNIFASLFFGICPLMALFCAIFGKDMAKRYLI